MAVVTRPEEQYDVIVIGGGTAGSNAARAAAETGAKTLMVHAMPWWNLCVQRGCMPSKSLLAVADTALSFEHAAALGIQAEIHGVSFGEVLGRKDEHINAFSSHLYTKLSEETYDICQGVATFTDETHVAIKTDEETHTVAGSRFVIATGSKPRIPPITGLADTPYITSDDVMVNAFKRCPDAVTILGAGPIGLEMATFFAGMGVSVHVIDLNPLLTPYGEQFGNELARAMRATGRIHVYAPAETTQVSYENETFSTTIVCNGETHILQSSELLVATGRIPAFDSLSLSHIGITPDPGISVTSAMQACDAASVYVAGDVTKDIQLLHVAAAEGRVAGHNAGIGTPEQTVDYEQLRMSVIFTFPPVAQVGITEPDANERGGTLTETVYIPDTGRATTMGIRYGYWSLTADSKTGTILGATILAPRADDLIHEVYLAMRLGATVHDINDLFGYHPTLSEQFFSLAEKLHHRMQKKS